ncbi:MAG: hypothetical protein BHW30_02755 [Firmicutes bacterium CAG_194_44_15]|nr:MAG: hypothetical protein BHW30_02755 [Firmicutes bacterium CAG_194_44_15]
MKRPSKSWQRRLRWSFPCLCTSVKIGQRIGEPGGFVSAPIHASVSGTVKAVEPRPFNMGGKMMSVVIENDFQDEISEEVKPVADPDSLTPEQLVDIVKKMKP